MDNDNLVASPARAHVGNALAAEAQTGAVLRARGHFELDRTVDGRDIDGVAQGRLAEIYAEVVIDIAALAPKQRMRPHAHRDVEIAVSAAARSRLALAAEPDLVAVVDAGWDGDLQGLARLHSP